MKVDFKKTVSSYKAKRHRFDVVDVPAMQFLHVKGHGGPGAPAYAAAIAALYPVAYTLKFHSKLELGKDYVVPPLEALWWAEDWAVFTTKFDQSQWEWAVMLMVPDWLGRDAFETALTKATAKMESATPEVRDALDQVRLERFDEGTCVQTLHLGPYAEEGLVLKQMHDTVIPEQGLQMRGKHHEIYFNDFRRTAPEKLKTILRQPVAQPGQVHPQD
ncbi:MAG: GyrI-like domain-containing protein [Planctomycetota bacterium]